MIDLSSALLSVPPPPPAPVLGADGAVAPPGSFGRTLDKFLDANDAALEPQSALPLVPARQATADSGKDLPPDPTDAAATPDPSAAPMWFAALPLLPAEPLPASDVAPASAPVGTERAIALPYAAPPPADDQPIVALPTYPFVPTATPTPQVVATIATPVTADPRSPHQAVPPTILDTLPGVFRDPPVVAAKLMIDAPRTALEASAARAAPSVDSPVPAMAVSTLPQPAGQAFASARAIAGSWRDDAPTATPALQGVATVVPQMTADPQPALQPIPPETFDAAPDVPRPTPLLTGKLAIDTPRIAPETKVATATVSPPTPARAIAISALPQPAGEVFAGARAIAGSWRPHAARTEDRDQTEVATSFATAAQIDLRERAIVQAAADIALDLTADTGLQRMIDRIETLRDTADAGDTHVRLIPDALGSIDVSVRQEGERLHVHFTAEHEATRALIAEAQPRLTELAAARGVRIGDASVSTGTGDGNAAANPQPRPAPPRAPASPTRADHADLPTDHRLA